MAVSREERKERANSIRNWVRIIMFMFIFSYLVLGVGIAMAVRGNSTVCIAALCWPTLFVGLFFVVVCMTGCCGGRQKFDSLNSRLYLVVGLFFVLLALIVVVVFNYVALSGKYWDTVSACLRHRNTCDDMSLTISPVQSGCCKPPSSCGFTYVNGTTWSPPTPGAGGAPAPAAVLSNDDDCSRWSNDQRTLCFQCDSCKARVLDDIKRVWHSSAAILVTVWTIVAVCKYPFLLLIYEECVRVRATDDDTAAAEHENESGHSGPAVVPSHPRRIAELASSSPPS